MVPIFVILTAMICIGIKLLAQRVRQAHTAEERKIGRSQWGLPEEAFLKC
jgi:hypothetical protein